MENNFKKSNVFYMVGVPASGKSTYADKKLKEDGVVTMSSDSLREELTGNEADVETYSHRQIFSILKERVLEKIKKGEDFVYDATGITPHFRRNDIIEWKKEGARLIGVLMTTPLDISKERNQKRERGVPEEVIDRMYNTLFENPLETDKDFFDEIILVDEEGREEKIFDRELKEGRKTISSETTLFPKVK